MISLKNTLSAIGSSISSITSSLGNVPHRTLLWTNSNLSAAFGATTINLDLTHYDEVEIQFVASSFDTRRTWISTDFVPVGKEGLLNMVVLGSDAAQMQYAMGRYLSVSTSSITFWSNRYAKIYGGFETGTSDWYCVPYKIYGIKYGGYCIVSRLFKGFRWFK